MMKSVASRLLQINNGIWIKAVSCGAHNYHPNEPSGPSVKTAIPGPKSKKLSEELNKIQVNSCIKWLFAP